MPTKHQIVGRLTEDERAVLIFAATCKRVWEALGRHQSERVSKALGSLLKRDYIWDESGGPGIHYYRATEAGVKALSENA